MGWNGRSRSRKAGESVRCNWKGFVLTLSVCLFLCLWWLLVSPLVDVVPTEIDKIYAKHSPVQTSWEKEVDSVDKHNLESNGDDNGFVEVKKAGWSSHSRKLLEALSDGSFQTSTESAKWSYENWKPNESDAQKIYVTYSTTRTSMLKALQNKRIFMYGTSFCRAIYFDIAKLILDMDELLAEDIFIPSYAAELRCGSTACNGKSPLGKSKYGEDCCSFDSGPNCNLPGRAGHDPTLCGYPSTRTIQNEEFNITVTFQFKTYILTENADQKVRDHLSSSHYDLMILGSAEWGRNMHLSTEMHDYDLQVRGFIDPLFEVFKGLKIFVYDHGYNTSTKKLHDNIAAKADSSVLIFNMQQLITSANKVGIRTQHGFSGAPTETMARSFLITAGQELQSQATLGFRR